MKSKVTVELDWTACPPGLLVRIADDRVPFWCSIQWRDSYWRVGFLPHTLEHHDINWDMNNRDCGFEGALTALEAAMDKFIVEYELE